MATSREKEGSYVLTTHDYLSAVVFKSFMYIRHLNSRILSRTHGSLLGSMLRILWNKNRRERRPYATKPGLGMAVNTLDPKKFAEKKQERLWIGDRTSFHAYIELRNRSTFKQIFKYDGRNGLQRTPPDIRGFLYYTIPLGRPRIGGEIRIRVTASEDPVSFASGSDLLRKDDRTWSRSLYQVSRTFIPVYQKLREEQLVSEELDSILSTLPNLFEKSQILYSLNDTFIFDFSQPHLNISVVTEQGMVTLEFHKHFVDARERRKRLPYTGSAIVRFERSTLPEHAGTRTVVLRFVKIITTVKCVIPLYDGHIRFPMEGELYHRRLHAKVWDLVVWNVDLDKSRFGAMLPGLRLLWNVTV